RQVQAPSIFRLDLSARVMRRSNEIPPVFAHTPPIETDIGIDRANSRSEADYRSHRRYTIALEAEYRLRDSRGHIQRRGTGTTKNMSSSGVFFSTADILPVGSTVELIASWPFLLDGLCPIRLFLRGQVTRCTVEGVALRITQYEFRTRGVPAEPLRFIRSE